MKYNKDYSTKTAKEWLAEKKWTAFLMQVPVGDACPFVVSDPNNLNSIRSTAVMLNADKDCPKRFAVKVDFANGAIAVTATLKDNGNA